jgi:hypothetical protein
LYKSLFDLLLSLREAVTEIAVSEPLNDESYIFWINVSKLEMVQDPDVVGVKREQIKSTHVPKVKSVPDLVHAHQEYLLFLSYHDLYELS